MLLDNLKPVNSTAKRVLQKGVHYEPEIKRKNIFHSDVPNLKLKPIEHLKKLKSFIDFTGFKFGFFEVIGMIDNESFQKKNKTRWLVRCSCGQYELRTTETLKKRINQKYLEDWCLVCDDMNRIRNSENARALGVSIEDYFYLKRKEKTG